MLIRQTDFLNETKLFVIIVIIKNIFRLFVIDIIF